MKNNIRILLCLILSALMMLSMIGISASASNSPFDEDLEEPETPDVPEDHEHSFSNWRDIPGVDIHIRHCDCGASEREVCVYDSGVVTRQPTSEKDGVKTYTCQECGGTKTEKIEKLASDKTNQGEGDKNNGDDKSNAWILPLVIAIVAALGVVACGVLIIKKKSAEKKVDNTDAPDDTIDEANEEN